MRGEFWAQRLGLMALVLLATRGVACTYATPKVDVPKEVPRFSPHQLKVTEVTVKNRDQPVPESLTAYVRDATHDILAEAAEDRGAAGGPAKVRIHVDLKDEGSYIEAAGAHDGCGAVPLLVAAPAGAMTEASDLTVDVDLEAGGQTFHGHGEANKNGSLYVDARRRALAVALDRALKDAASKVRYD